VSCCTPPGLYLNHWHAFMKFYLACKPLCTSWAPFESLTCLYEIPSSLWVPVHLLGSTWIIDMSSWNPIQRVSCCALLRLYSNCWDAFIKSIQRVSCCVLFGLYLNCSDASMKSHLGCELLCTFFIWITEMPLWNLIQAVSCCAPSGL